ncbi:MAG: hypothetical protein J7K40_06290 [candidate division Zixibacteria bacterium]|nr:hypothetical protein [candidate division Zixibacteria bacterium]
MRKFSQITIIIVALLIIMGFAAQAVWSDDVSDLNNYPNSARIIAMGNIGESLPLNSTGMFGNPASIWQISGIEYSLMYYPHDDDNTYIHSAALMYSHGKITEFFGLRVGFRAIPENRKYFNFDIPEHHYRMGVFGMAYAITKLAVIGVSGDIYQNKLEDKDGTAFGVNIGAQIRLSILTLSATARNIAKINNSENDYEKIELPSAINSGAYVSLLDGIIGLGIQAELGSGGKILRYSLGSEFTFGKFLSIRAGHETTNLEFNEDEIDESLFSFGCGINLGNLRADYAAKKNPELEDDYIHYVTFGINGTDFGQKK